MPSVMTLLRCAENVNDNLCLQGHRTGTRDAERDAQARPLWVRSVALLLRWPDLAPEARLTYTPL